MSAVPSLPLSRLPVGCEGVITRLEVDGPVRRRLLALGLIVGTSIRVMRVAPLGDPLALQVRGTQLALRQAMAGRILVRPLPES